MKRKRVRIQKRVYHLAFSTILIKMKNPNWDVKVEVKFNDLIIK